MSLTRRALLSGALVAAAGALTGCAPGTSRTTVIGAALGNTFLSGSSCIGAADGEFGRWRGKPSTIAATWAADGGLDQIQDEWEHWTGSLDYAPQYRLQSQGGFSWERLADGEFDTRLRTDLRRLQDAWGDRDAALNYRFQHEFNGDWYPWSVDETNVAVFVQGWQRFAELFRSTLAGDDRFRLVWSANGGTPSKRIRDLRSAWPGSDYVDVVGVDYYDFFPIATRLDWRRQVDATDQGGGPVGIGAFLAFAQEKGKPLAVPEWGNQHGDNPLLIEVMHDFMAEHLAETPGRTAGKVLYEVYFNQRLHGGDASSGDFRLQERGVDAPIRPRAASAYRRLWSGWNAI